jgi:hypothetical protein
LRCGDWRAKEIPSEKLRKLVLILPGAWVEQKAILTDIQICHGQES